MDYKRIHKELLNVCLSTSPKERLAKRNKGDTRLNSPIYTEVHHIIPRSLGGTDCVSNLVELLPEEHIFIHMLRYRIYNMREDMLAVRFMLNGYSSRKSFNKKTLNKKIRTGYAWIRSNSARFRIENGWQSEEGKRKISESRKGKMPVMDSLTGEKIGSVSTEHENVVSGKWVHVTKGRKFSTQEKNNISKRHKVNNPNHSGLNDEYFIQKGLDMLAKYGRILSWAEMVNLSYLEKFEWIKSAKSRFDGGGIGGYYKILENKSGMKYDPWETRRK
jgi:hypothetical protein